MKELKVNAKELAIKLLALNNDEHINFTTEFTKTDEIFEPSLVSSWYGAKRLRAFDSSFILVGYYGGGYINAFEINDINGEQESTLFWLTKDVEIMFNELNVKNVIIEIQDD
jgi:hypothetical protein